MIGEGILDVERINTYSASMTIIGWLAGLAYYNWLSSDPISVPLWAHVVLIVGGMFFASIVIGGGLAMLAAGLTKIVAGGAEGSPHAFSWAAFVGAVMAFFAAGYGLSLFA